MENKTFEIFGQEIRPCPRCQTKHCNTFKVLNLLAKKLDEKKVPSLTTNVQSVYKSVCSSLMTSIFMEKLKQETLKAAFSQMK